MHVKKRIHKCIVVDTVHVFDFGNVIPVIIHIYINRKKKSVNFFNVPDFKSICLYSIQHGCHFSEICSYAN